MKVKNCKSIYSFNVMNEIMQGKVVFCVDKYELESFVVNEITVNKLATILEISAKVTSNRFEFWILEEEEDE